MTPLSKQAAAIFAKLTRGMNDVGDHRKIDTSDGAYMAVVVEIIGRPDIPNCRPETKIVSVAHYFEQEGDLCQDPEVTFLWGPDAIYPMTFQQAIPPIYQEAIRFEDGKILVAQRTQKDIAVFCNQWMKNIAEQQNLD